jgi:fructosamine-3-kinase
MRSGGGWIEHLYHLFTHTLLFGGGYAGQADAVIRGFL